jgi:hypothetical protein
MNLRFCSRIELINNLFDLEKRHLKAFCSIFFYQSDDLVNYFYVQRKKKKKSRFESLMDYLNAMFNE